MNNETTIEGLFLNLKETNDELFIKYDKVIKKLKLQKTNIGIYLANLSIILEHIKSINDKFEFEKKMTLIEDETLQLLKLMKENLNEK